MLLLSHHQNRKTGIDVQTETRIKLNPKETCWKRTIMMSSLAEYGVAGGTKGGDTKQSSNPSPLIPKLLLLSLRDNRQQ